MVLMVTVAVEVRSGYMSDGFGCGFGFGFGPGRVDVVYLGLIR